MVKKVKKLYKNTLFVLISGRGVIRRAYIYIKRGSKMKFEELKKVIEGDLRLSIEKSNGLTVLSKGSSRFENWLHIEAAGALAKGVAGRKKVVSEAVLNVSGRDVEVDLLVENEWAIELRVIGEEEKRAGAETVKALKADIEKLKAIKKGYSEKNINMNTAVAYFVLPSDSRAYAHENMLSEAFGTDNSAFIEDKKSFFLNDNSVKGAIYLREV